MKNPLKAKYVYLMLSVFGAISLSLIFFFMLYRFQGLRETIDQILDILKPFVYGGVLAYLLRPACNWYEDTLTNAFGGKLRKLAPSLAVTLSMITGFFVVYVLIIMIGPELGKSIRNIWNSMPDKVNRFIEWITVTFGENEKLIDFLQSGYETLYVKLEGWVQDTLLPQVTGLFSLVTGVGQSVVKLFGFLLDFLIGLIVAVYLLSSRKRFAKQGVMLVRSALKPRWANLVLEEIAFVDRVFGGFIDGKIVDSAIIGVLCYIGCMVFKFPNALLIAAFVGITNVIPFFGPFIGAIPSTLLILIEDPIKALWFVVFVLGLQQLDGNVIGPKILGDRTGISSFWVLFTIILFGGMWGVVGMVVAVPLFAVIYDTIKKLVRRGLYQKGQLEVWEQYKADYPDEEPGK
jgi:predicted PurR-regulated permease PerM